MLTSLVISQGCVDLACICVVFFLPCSHVFIPTDQQLWRRHMHPYGDPYYTTARRCHFPLRRVIRVRRRRQVAAVTARPTRLSPLPTLLCMAALSSDANPNSATARRRQGMASGGQSAQRSCSVKSPSARSCSTLVPQVRFRCASLRLGPVLVRSSECCHIPEHQPWLLYT